MSWIGLAVKVVPDSLIRRAKALQQTLRFEQVEKERQARLAEDIGRRLKGQGQGKGERVPRKKLTGSETIFGRRGPDRSIVRRPIGNNGGSVAGTIAAIRFEPNYGWNGSIYPQIALWPEDADEPVLFDVTERRSLSFPADPYTPEWSFDGFYAYQNPNPWDYEFYPTDLYNIPETVSRFYSHTGVYAGPRDGPNPDLYYKPRHGGNGWTTLAAPGGELITSFVGYTQVYRHAWEGLEVIEPNWVWILPVGGEKGILIYRENCLKYGYRAYAQFTGEAGYFETSVDVASVPYFENRMWENMTCASEGTINDDRLVYYITRAFLFDRTTAEEIPVPDAVAAKLSTWYVQRATTSTSTETNPCEGRGSPVFIHGDQLGFFYNGYIGVPYKQGSTTFPAETDATAFLMDIPGLVYVETAPPFENNQILDVNNLYTQWGIGRLDLLQHCAANVFSPAVFNLFSQDDWPTTAEEYNAATDNGSYSNVKAGYLNGAGTRDGRLISYSRSGGLYSFYYADETPVDDTTPISVDTGEPVFALTDYEGTDDPRSDFDVYLAWDWDDPAYCKTKLSALGFNL